MEYVANIVDGKVSGIEEYELNGKMYSGTDAVGKMCRILKEGVLKIYRGDMLCLVIDIAKRAKKSLWETDAKGLHVGVYVPYETYKPAATVEIK